MAEKAFKLEIVTPRKVVFSGTFTSGGLELETGNGTLKIVQEGRHSKFVSRIQQICYNAPFAASQGRKAVDAKKRPTGRSAQRHHDVRADSRQLLFQPCEFGEKLWPEVLAGFA